MAKTSKKALGAVMTGVMAVGAVAGAANAVDQVKVANAAESQAQKDAKAKISHTIYSINKNYAGIKNQVQWEAYIKEARALIAKMPASESAIADALTKQVDGLADTVLAIARINHVEKSYEVNHKGIKNAAQWREYLDLAKEDMKSVDQSVFAAKYEELVKRYNDASDKVKAIEDAHAVDLAAAEKLYEAAKASMNIDDAKKALAAAEALGTHATSDALEAKIKALIAQIEKVEIDVKTVSIDSKTYDDNKGGQRLSIKVNGEPMNIDFLAAAGYSIEFNALDDTGAQANKTLFGEATEATVNNNGKLADKIAVGDYKVQVTVSKNGNVVVSSKTTINVKNLDSEATTISKYELLNNTTTTVQNSNTLVAGDTAQFQDVYVSNGSTSSKIDAADVKVESSNPAVVSVNTSGVITAEGPGTAKVTVSYGEAKKEINITVASVARKITKVVPSTSTVKVLAGGKTEVKVKVLDQYGDPVKVSTGVTAEVPTGSGATAVINTVLNQESSADNKLVTDAYGEEKLIVTAGSRVGSEVVRFVYNGNNIGVLNVTTTNVTTLEKSKLEIKKVPSNDLYSDDTTIVSVDGETDSIVKLQLNSYTTEGVFNGAKNLGGYTVKYDSDVLDVKELKISAGVDQAASALVANTFDTTTERFEVTAKKAGKSDIVIYDAAGIEVGRTTINATNGVSITGVKWNTVADIKNVASSVAKVSDVLNLTKSADDDIVDKSILTLSTSTPHKIRISEDSATAGVIYVDKNDDGKLDSGERKLGVVTAKVTSDTTGVTGLTGSAVTDIFAGVGTAADAKGTVIFTLTDYKADQSTTNLPVATTSIKIAVQ